MSVFGPMLDEEPYCSNPTLKLIHNIQLPLENCSIDKSASLDVSISLENPRAKAPLIIDGGLRETMMKAVVGKPMSTQSEVEK